MIDETKQEIQELGLNAIREFFKVDLSKLDKNLIQGLHNKAKIAMQFEKEIGVNKRAIEMNYLRVFRLVAEDKSEIKKLIKKSLPKYLA